MSTTEITSGVELLKVMTIALTVYSTMQKKIMKIDPSNDETTLVGEEYNGVGKWRNGFTHGDFIYGIPYKEYQFLKYNVKPNHPNWSVMTLEVIMGNGCQV